ncbi:stage II sporulation protein R [Psychrobacillus psychrodurans]|uniref:stage II sporulation protein R n=1 Tax=Psychrobacillus psychrodurans TaxID=126157 RepID=UPI0008DFFD96|nr:stage II sporulation protein R [Psychrobacillus psychrodurans]MCZ8538973.1 stage II sporulation protein R [Psychrobacillus psychrodurans]SFM26038.1 stage II sporulation protein R [Psychrobacillus psychrodurans]
MLPDYEIKKAPSIGKQIDAAIFFVWMLLLIQFCLFLLFQQGEEVEGIRFRLIANSNTIEDQQVKNDVKHHIEPILLNYENNPQKTYSDLEQAIEKLSSSLNTNITITKGLASFPPKVWQEGISSQVMTESIVISIGNARGDNWWCALFPKVCYKEEVKEEKPKFWVWEWLKKKFST